MPRLGRSLLGRVKEVHEHQVVVESIVRRLQKAGLSSVVVERARLRLLPNVQHLSSPISAALPSDWHLLDVLATLHPTPAVGGQPRDAARADIARSSLLTGVYTRAPWAGLTIPVTANLW